MWKMFARIQTSGTEEPQKRRWERKKRNTNEMRERMEIAREDKAGLEGENGVLSKAAV